MTDRRRDRDGWGRPLRLGLAIGTLLAGVVAFSSGAARIGAQALRSIGFAEGLAVQAAAVAAALVPLAVGIATMVVVGAERRHFRLGGVGVVLGVVGIAVGLGSADPLADPAVVALYLGGLVLIVGSLVRGVVTSSSRPPSHRTRHTPGFTRQDTSDHVLPSDGGEEADDLEFPLDDEE